MADTRWQFEKKLSDYGASWRMLRPQPVIGQTLSDLIRPELGDE